MKITIVNFKKFNPRSDLKSMPWLRLQNNFFDEEDFFDEDVNTTWLFIFLLCQCAQKVNQTLELREKYLISKSKLTKKQFHDALNRLKDKGLILLGTNESDRISTDSCLTNERNEENEDDPSAIDLILDVWNRNAPQYNLPSVKILNTTRKKKLQLALKDFREIEDWRKIFSVASKKGFVGKDGRKFTPNWDYVFKNNNWVTFYDEYDILFSDSDESKNSLNENIALELISSLST